MIRRLMIFLLLFNFPYSLAEAHEHNDELGEIRILNEFEKEGVAVAVVVKEGGHLLGQPYQVELRAQCDGRDQDIKRWPVVDSFSVCDLSPSSGKLNRQQTAFAIKAKMADLQDFDRQVEQGIMKPILHCQNHTKIKKFTLKKLCP